MMKKAAAAALKYAGKKMAANAAKKAKKGAARIARAVKSNPGKNKGKRPRYLIKDDGYAALDTMIQEFIPREADEMLFARVASAIGPKEARRLISRAARAAGKRPGAYGVPEANHKGGQGRDPLAQPHQQRDPLGFFKVDRRSRLSGKEVKPNPYDQKGATFDLFGGESRALPKKVSEFHRPRLRIRGQTATFAEGSPFKGRVARVNPAPRVVVQPLRVTLTASEVKAWAADPDGFVSVLLAKAAQQSAAWDHIEARGPGGRHLFDVVP